MFAASACARDSESRVKNEMVKPTDLAAAVSAATGGVAESGGATTAVESTAVAAESKVTGWSSDAARGRKPVHQNENQKSAAPPWTFATCRWVSASRNSTSLPRATAIELSAATNGRSERHSERTDPITWFAPSP